MLKETPAGEVAVYIFTGMVTRPKEIAPEPIACGGMVETISRRGARVFSSPCANR
jgi:hypothetical protein